MISNRFLGFQILGSWAGLGLQGSKLRYIKVPKLGFLGGGTLLSSRHRREMETSTLDTYCSIVSRTFHDRAPFEYLITAHPIVNQVSKPCPHPFPFPPSTPNNYLNEPFKLEVGDP